MQKHSISVLTTILVSLVILLTMVDSCNASHETMNMNQPNLWLTLLQSLRRNPSPPPGDGCGQTPNGGNNCKPSAKPLVKEKAFASRHEATSTTSSPPPPSFLVHVGTTTNRKLMMWSHGV
ncbi:hypothetical protein HanIR_Chr10g0456271 [Helianthus annuus]|nr:hypothetical protein HanIR_Chr10g0456271 [Helianthus annuus]